MDNLHETMCRRLGPDLTQKIFSCFAGQDLHIPSKVLLDAARRNRQIAELHEDGVSVRELSKRFGISQTQIWRIVSGRGACRPTVECMRRLEENLGARDAKRLTEAFPGASLYICKSASRERRDEDIRAAFPGSSVTELARRYGLSRRRVYTILKGGDYT